MKIAILGASSQIARDLTKLLVADKQKQLYLFGRQTPFLDYQEFARHTYDVVINFVGAGNPQKTAAMGCAILDITAQYDQLALTYLTSHPACKYIFLSSGAAYGGEFDQPVTAETNAIINFNSLKSQDWYSVAKLYAECRHRALSDFYIYDIRVFNYFSHTQDMSARFLITDIIRAIKSNIFLEISSDYIVRDFITPTDFCHLIDCIIKSPPSNMAIDCYTKAPIDKPTLLEVMHDHFDLKYKVTDKSAAVNATGLKPHYYSLNRSAEKLGYLPQKTSIEGIVDETKKLFAVSGFKK